jgi:diacylglycerol kinase family enzyme
VSGAALYPVSALRQLFGYRGIEIELSSLRNHRDSARHLMLIVANAKHFGGAFHIAPRADLTDGHLDAIAILDANPLRRLPLFMAATRGTHVDRPGVICEQSPIFRLRFKEPPAYETDGEYHRSETDELELRCVPSALRVVVSKAAADAYARAASSTGHATVARVE